MDKEKTSLWYITRDFWMHVKHSHKEHLKVEKPVAHAPKTKISAISFSFTVAQKRSWFCSLGKKKTTSY